MPRSVETASLSARIGEPDFDAELLKIVSQWVGYVFFVLTSVADKNIVFH
jgi:hypothetical protein